MKISCPNCGQHLEGDESFVGQTIECPTCSNQFVIVYNADTRISKDLTATDNCPSEHKNSHQKDRKGLIWGCVITSAWSAISLWIIVSCLRDMHEVYGPDPELVERFLELSENNHNVPDMEYLYLSALVNNHSYSPPTLDDYIDLFAIGIPIFALPIVGLLSAVRRKFTAELPARLGLAVFLLAMLNGIIGTLCSNVVEATLILVFCIAEPIICIWLYVFLFAKRRKPISVLLLSNIRGKIRILRKVVLIQIRHPAGLRRSWRLSRCIRRREQEALLQKLPPSGRAKHRLEAESAKLDDQLKASNSLLDQLDNHSEELTFIKR